MKNGVFEYKGYLGSAEVDTDAFVLVGKLLFIKDVIAYSAADAKGLEAAFKEAVDDYLETCAEVGRDPEVPCKGTFNVRVSPQVHRDAALAARRKDITLNQFVCEALAVALEEEKKPQAVEHNHTRELKVTFVESETRVVTAGQPLQWEQPHGGAH